MATVLPYIYNADGLGLKPMATSDSIDFAGGTISGDFAFSGGAKITGLPTTTPSADDEAVSYAVLKQVANGLPPKPSCVYGTTEALPANTTSAGPGVGRRLTATANGALSVDSNAPSVDDRILVKNEGGGASHANNGIFKVIQTGDAGTPWILERVTDFDESTEVKGGATTFINEGATLGNSRWTLVTDDPITVDTTALQFDRTDANLYSEGDGISITDGVIAIDRATDSGLEFTGGNVRVNVDGTTLTRGSGTGTIGVDGVPSLFEINEVAVSANVTSANLGTLTDGSSAADSLHTHNSVNSSKRVENEYTAVENSPAWSPVEWSTTNDKFQIARADTPAKLDVIGVLEEGSQVDADAVGTVISLGDATVTIGSAAAGDRIYLGDTGGMVRTKANVSSGNHLVYLGTMKSATVLHVSIQYEGVKP
jgi:hypothetical protein